MTLSPDTIAAIATAPGRGGIGIVRLSGPAALSLARLLAPSLPPLPVPARASFCRLLEPATGAPLDEALVTYYAAPRSYTGEDVVELAAHGSPVLLDHLLRLLLAHGARLAEPGEFTERAFLSGRLDLTQAEAVRDLIDAQTLLQAQVAAQQLGGALAHAVAPIKQQLVALIAMLEAGIDFAEDDTPVASTEAILAAVATLIASLEPFERSFTQGRLLIQGVTLAIVGRPNAGKSSLFNRLLARDRAIVTSEPGTTRDTVAERLSLGGIPVELIDTAGLREAATEAERIGILRSREAFADAGLVLLVLDATEPLNQEERALLAGATGRPLVIALNKSDLLATSACERSVTDGTEEMGERSEQRSQQSGPNGEQAYAAENRSARDRASLAQFTQNEAGLQPSATEPGQAFAPPLFTTAPGLVQTPPALAQLDHYAAAAPRVLCSAQTGDCIPALQSAMQSLLLGSRGAAPEAAMLTNLRQHTAVAATLAALHTAQQAAHARLPHELLLLDLYNALRELDLLTGVTTPDGILRLIFSTFCIGK